MPINADCPYDPRICQQEFRALREGLAAQTGKMDAMSSKLDRVLSIEGPIAKLQQTMAETTMELHSVQARIGELRSADESIRDEMRDEARSVGGKTGGFLGAVIAAAIAVLWKVVEHLIGGPGQ